MKSFFIKTYGCTQNQADSIIMSNLLAKKGFKRVSSKEEADIIIVNTCTVKEPTESKIIKYISSIKGKGAVITGCMSRTRRKILSKKFKYPLIGCDNILDIAEACNGVLKESLDTCKISKVNLTPIRKDKIIEIIPVCSGCLGECAYCATRIARGELYSYPLKEIVRHARDAVNSGAKELWITAQDTGAYGCDNKTTIIKLLNEILKIKGDYLLRIGMMNPYYAFIYRKELSKILQNEHVFKFVHLPVQSGSSRILKLMKRRYSAEQFIKTCDYLKSEVRNLTISTDVIIGFPGETKSDFNQTIELIKAVRPNIVNISRFWRHKNTEAYNMKSSLSIEEVKRRVRIAKELHLKIALENNKAYLGRTLKVLVEKNGRAISESYKIVNINGLTGERKECRIIRVSSTALFGKEL